MDDSRDLPAVKQHRLLRARRQRHCQHRDGSERGAQGRPGRGPGRRLLLVGPVLDQLQVVVAEGPEAALGRLQGGRPVGPFQRGGGLGVAAALGSDPVWFPSHHGGFLGGEYGQTGDPDGFATTLLALHGGTAAAWGRPAQVLTPELMETLYGVRAEFLQTASGPVLAPCVEDW